jgi:hypothetical protein
MVMLPGLTNEGTGVADDFLEGTIPVQDEYW